MPMYNMQGFQFLRKHFMFFRLLDTDACTHVLWIYKHDEKEDTAL